MNGGLHWIMTVRRTLADGRYADSTLDGVCTPRPGATRQEIFHECRGLACDYYGADPLDVVMLHFSFGANDI